MSRWTLALLLLAACRTGRVVCGDCHVGPVAAIQIAGVPDTKGLAERIRLALEAVADCGRSSEQMTIAGLEPTPEAKRQPQGLDLSGPGRAPFLLTPLPAR